MSLALATKGILPDFTGTGTGIVETIYVLENFNVDVSQIDVEIEITVLDEISIDVSDINVNIDVELDEIEVIVLEDNIINIEV